MTELLQGIQKLDRHLIEFFSLRLVRHMPGANGLPDCAGHLIYHLSK
jgi:hypothetical protein